MSLKASTLMSLKADTLMMSLKAYTLMMTIKGYSLKTLQTHYYKGLTVDIYGHRHCRHVYSRCLRQQASIAIEEYRSLYSSISP